MELYRTPFLDSLSQLPAATVIFSDEGKQVLAGELHKRSISLALGLRNMGFKENDRVVLLVPPGMEFLEIFLPPICLEVWSRLLIRKWVAIISSQN